jgi:PST family polysaccharide transporter
MTDVLVAVGRGRTAFRLQAVWLVVLVPALTIGAHLGGIVGAGWAHILTAALVVVPLHLRAIRPLGIRFRALARATARPAAATVGAGIVAAVVVLALVQPDPVILLAAGAAALVVLVVIMAPMRHEALEMVR